MKKIVLTDSSTMSCMSTFNKEFDRNKPYVPTQKLILKVIRTITHGEPYYCKYGFYPENEEDIKIYKHNRKIFNEHPKLKSIKWMVL